jgi:hypothetical protein
MTPITLICIKIASSNLPAETTKTADGVDYDFWYPGRVSNQVPVERDV